MFEVPVLLYKTDEAEQVQGKTKCPLSEYPELPAKSMSLKKNRDAVKSTPAKTVIPVRCVRMTAAGSAGVKKSSPR